MGNNSSSPQKHIFDNPHQLKDEILKQMSLEVQITQRHLEHSKHILERDAYNTHKRQIEELKVKFIEFYKYTQINDGMIKRLTTTNAELEKTLNEYKKELLRHETEKEDLKKNLNIKEQDLLSKCLLIDTNERLEEDIKQCKNKCEIYERQIKNLKSDVVIETQLRQKAEIALKAYYRQTASFKDLQEKLTQSQESLGKERMINQEGSFKLEAVTQYCENLNKQLEQNAAQQEEDTDQLKKTINELENQLSKTKINLGKSRRDVRLSEELRKKAEINLEEKQKELDDYLNQLELLKTCYVKAVGSTDSAEDEKKVDKLFFNFISNYENKLNSTIHISDQKSKQAQNNSEGEIEKYKQRIEELRSELRSSEVKFQSEEKLKREFQGKLFLVEKSFNSLQTFCSKELQDLKFYLKNEKIGPMPDSSMQQESNDLITLETETTEDNKLLSLKEEKQETVELPQEKFCANQQKEMSQLFNEFQSVFSNTS